MLTACDMDLLSHVYDVGSAASHPAPSAACNDESSTVASLRGGSVNTFPVRPCPMQRTSPKALLFELLLSSAFACTATTDVFFPSLCRPAIGA